MFNQLSFHIQSQTEYQAVTLITDDISFAPFGQFIPGQCSQVAASHMLVILLAGATSEVGLTGALRAEAVAVAAVLGSPIWGDDGSAMLTHQVFQ